MWLGMWQEDHSARLLEVAVLSISASISASASASVSGVTDLSVWIHNLSQDCARVVAKQTVAPSEVGNFKVSDVAAICRKVVTVAHFPSALARNGAASLPSTLDVYCSRGEQRLEDRGPVSRRSSASAELSRSLEVNSPLKVEDSPSPRFAGAPADGGVAHPAVSSRSVSSHRTLGLDGPRSLSACELTAGCPDIGAARRSRRSSVCWVRCIVFRALSRRSCLPRFVGSPSALPPAFV
eukprot:1189946-Prorocentrum_minimum.AAC.2